MDPYSQYPYINPGAGGNIHGAHPYMHTGYGPVGFGNAPTAHQMRMMDRNRFHSDNVSLMMQFVDPVVQNMQMQAMSITSAANSPAAARRAAYGSAGGQAAMDALMVARRLGVLGYGDPINYSHNIVQGIAGGGFHASTSGYIPGGTHLTYNPSHRVSGNGMIAERVAMNYQKGLLQDLYGSGSADPSRLHGFDMAEMGGVFATIARRGGLGHAAHIEHGASAKRRLLAARMDYANGDPMIKDALDAIKLSDNGEYANNLELLNAAERAQDPKIRNAIESVRKGSSAMFVNEQGRKEVARTVKGVIEGMAALSDIYGELNAPQLRQKLEEISGLRITNLNQARRAQEMVSNLRGAAEVSGMDPRAFMEYSAYNQAMLQGHVARTYGFDARYATGQRGVAASINNDVMSRAADIAAISRTGSKRAAEFGIDSRVITADEAAADLTAGQLQYAERYQGTLALSGMNLQGASAAERDRLLGEFAAAGGDSRKRQLVESRIRRFIARQASSPGNEVDFATAMASPVMKQALVRSRTDRGVAAWHTHNVREGRNLALNPAFVLSGAADIGVDLSEAEARRMVSGLGASGMVEILAQDNAMTRAAGPGAVRAAQMRHLKQAGYSDVDANRFLDQFFGADGRVKDGRAYRYLAGKVGNTTWGGVSVYDQMKISENYINGFGASGAHRRLRSDGGFNLKNIITAMATGKQDGAYDPESMALAIAAMNDAGMSLGNVSHTDEFGNTTSVNYARESAYGINFKNGLTYDGLGELDKVNGGDIGLAKRLGFKSRWAMIKASEKDKGVLARALRELKFGEAYSHLKIGGTAGDMSVVTQRLLEFEKTRNAIDEPMRRLAGAELIFGKEGSALTDAIKNRGDVSATLQQIFGGAGSADAIGSLHRGIMGANVHAMKGLAALNKGGELRTALENQIASMGDGETLSVRGPDGKEQKLTKDDLEKSLKKLIEGQLGAEDGVQKTGVMHVEMLKVENVSPFEN